MALLDDAIHHNRCEMIVHKGAWIHPDSGWRYRESAQTQLAHAHALQHCACMCIHVSLPVKLQTGDETLVSCDTHVHAGTALTSVDFTCDRHDASLAASYTSDVCMHLTSGIYIL